MVINDEFNSCKAFGESYMSVERQITKEIDAVLSCIRRAEANIIGMDAANKMDIVEKLVGMEESVKAIKADVSIPELQITKDTPIRDLMEEGILSVRASNVLMRSGCSTIEDVTKRTSDEIATMRNMGKKAYEEVLEFLNKNGFEIKSEE